MKNHEDHQSATDLMPQDVESQRILRERAEQLAKQEIKKNEASNIISYVRFQLGAHEHYGIPYHMAKEVLRKTLLTEIPCVPNFIAGVINRRGLLLTILDLKKFFQLQTSKQDKNSYIIVVAANDITIGILVDEVEGSDIYDSSYLDVSLPSEGTVKSEYIAGLHNGSIAIINIEAVMCDLIKELQKHK